MEANGRSSDSGLPPVAAFPAVQASGVRRESVSPHSGGTVPDLHRRSPTARLVCGGIYHRRVTRWLPVVVWAAVIFALSSIPHLSTGLGTWDTILRKGAHVTEYAILAVLLVRALEREVPAFVLGVLYAISDEVHQHFVRGRHASPVDVAIDSFGLAVGLFARRRAARTIG